MAGFNPKAIPLYYQRAYRSTVIPEVEAQPRLSGICDNGQACGRSRLCAIALQRDRGGRMTGGTIGWAV